MNQQQTQSRLQQLASEASALFDKADAEGRQLTPEERDEAKEKVARFKDLQSQQQVFDVAAQIGGSDTAGLTGGDGRLLARSDAGRAFVESEGYEAIADPATRGQRCLTFSCDIAHAVSRSGVFARRSGTVAWSTLPKKRGA